MKYGEHLKANIAPEYGAENYMQYEKMDRIISELSETKPSRYVMSYIVVERVLSWPVHLPRRCNNSEYFASFIRVLVFFLWFTAFHCKGAAFFLVCPRLQI